MLGPAIHMAILLPLALDSCLEEVYFLKALAMIESGINDKAIGSQGERSRYQIMPFVWKHFAPKLDIEIYGECSKCSSKIALLILDNINDFYRHYNNKQPNWFDTYIMWNRGPAWYQKKNFDFSKCDLETKDRAIRFFNLQYIYKNKN